MNKKAESLKDFFEEQNITVFETEELDDEFKTVLFQSKMEVGGQILPVVIFLDSSIYSMIRLRIVDKVIVPDKEVTLLPHLNRLNQKYKVFKYYTNSDGALFLDCCIPSTDENFEPQMIRALLEVMLNHITEEYAGIMELVWKEQD